MRKTSPSSNSKASNSPTDTAWETALEREPYLYLTTRGRRSGHLREIEIWFTHHDSRFYVIAEYPTSHWVQNLQADPRVEVRAAGKKFAARAEFVSPEVEPELHRAIQEQSRSKYGWGEGVVVLLNPEPAP
ncbi:MAG: nitroreductase family deazaflavin-dependent oxidoreductase [Terriglobales bacterium]